MKTMIELSNGVIYVKGAKNAAIYDFNSSNVYSINQDGIAIIDRIIIAGEPATFNVENEYINALKQCNLISDSFQPREYIVPKNNKIKFDFVWLELTSACNMRCVHCYEGQQHYALKNELSVNDWKNVL